MAADPPAQQNQEEAEIVTVSMPPDDPAPAPEPPLLLQIPTAAASSLPKGVLHVLVVQSTGVPTAAAGLQAVLVPAAGSEDNAPGPDPIPPAREWELRGWLMVLATLIASITYASGLSPPGGFEVKEVRTPGTANTKNQQQQFMPVLLEVSDVANTLAFALSLSIIMLLASQGVRKLAKTKAQILVALDVLPLWVAYICGSSFNGIVQTVSLAIVFLLLLALTIRGKYFWDEL